MQALSLCSDDNGYARRALGSSVGRRGKGESFNKMRERLCDATVACDEVYLLEDSADDNFLP